MFAHAVCYNNLNFIF